MQFPPKQITDSHAVTQLPVFLTAYINQLSLIKPHRIVIMLIRPLSVSYKKRPADTISTGHGRLLYCPALIDFTGFLTDVPLRMSLLPWTPGMPGEVSLS